MNSSELRIGNYVGRKDIGSGEDRIETIIALGEKVTTTGPIKVICAYDDLMAIPLNEEWLLKFGFELINGNKYRNGHIELLDGPNHCYEYFYGGFTKIKYVHQLQNLYFALTGEELEIKEQVTSSD